MRPTFCTGNMALDWRTSSSVPKPMPTPDLTLQPATLSKGAKPKVPLKHGTWTIVLVEALQQMLPQYHVFAEKVEGSHLG